MVESACLFCKGPRPERTDTLGGWSANWTAGRLQRLGHALVRVFCRQGPHLIGAGAASWAVVRKPHSVCVQVLNRVLGSPWAVLGSSLGASFHPPGSRPGTWRA